MTRRWPALALVPVALYATLFAQTAKSVWAGVYTTAPAGAQPLVSDKDVLAGIICTSRPKS